MLQPALEVGPYVFEYGVEGEDLLRRLDGRVCPVAL